LFISIFVIEIKMKGNKMKTIFGFLLVIMATVSLAYSQNETEEMDKKSPNQEIPNKDFYSDDVVFDTDSLYHITMKNGTSYIGTILEENDKELKILSHEIGEVTLSKAFIESKKLISEERVSKGVYWFPNPNSTRNLFSPTGYGLKAGEGYYQNIYVFFNMLNFGLTDYFSIGFGTEFLSLSHGVPLIIINPKFSFELNENFHLGIGSFLIGASIVAEYSIIGIHHGVLTYGNEDDNISLGAGVISSGNEDLHSVFTISGMLRLSKGTALVSENWFGSSALEDISYSSLFSYAIRIMGESYSFDLGFINNSNISDTFILGIPYVDFIVKW
jgi:hypothetical protein